MHGENRKLINALYSKPQLASLTPGKVNEI